MIIKEIRFKNFKSYGNKQQVVKFSEKPELILLQGRTGAGKSSILESIDLAIYSKVRGKNKKSIPLIDLPNRRNKNLEVIVDFINNNEQKINIQRNVNPNAFDVKLNDKPYTERFKTLTDDDRDKLIGFNYDTFKSFISMSINDFLNFIQLQSVDKKNLLNKIFNLEKLDSYLSITKDLLKNLLKKIEALTDEILNNNNLIEEYSSTIEIIYAQVSTSKQEKMVALIKDGQEKSEKRKHIKEEVRKIDIEYSTISEKLQELKNKIKILKEEISALTNDNSLLDEKIKVFESGNCPLCNTKLKDHSHIEQLTVYYKTKESNNKRVEYLNEEINKVNREGRETEVSYNVVIRKRNNYAELNNKLKLELENIKKEYLSAEKSDTNNITADSLQNKITELKNKNIILTTELDKSNKKKDDYEKLINLFDDTGIRKSIIRSLVKPINQYIDEFLNEIDFKYRAVLNDDFNATVYEFGITKINPEVLSNGEMKIINIIIAFSYIKMIRSMKSINILFLDEIFVSIDTEYISMLIKLLKKLSIDLNTNVITMHHGILDVDTNNFDRVIKVINTQFSDIKTNEDDRIDIKQDEYLVP
jgi:DNA repair exonuclease SbcCD ATPase subunit